MCGGITLLLMYVEVQVMQPEVPSVPCFLLHTNAAYISASMMSVQMSWNQKHELKVHVR
jgi:hypothetical protein